MVEFNYSDRDFEFVSDSDHGQYVLENLSSSGYEKDDIENYLQHRNWNKYDTYNDRTVYRMKHSTGLLEATFKDDDFYLDLPVNLSNQILKDVERILSEGEIDPPFTIVTHVERSS